MVTDESFSLQIKGIHFVFCKNWGSYKSRNALPESVLWKNSLGPTYMFDHCNIFYPVREAKSNYWKKFSLAVKQKTRLLLSLVWLCH